MAEKITITSDALMYELARHYKGNVNPVMALIVLLLYAISKHRGKKFNISEQALAERCMTTKATINRAKKRLQELGLISWIQGSYKNNKGTTNTYDVTGLHAFVEKCYQKYHSQNNNGMCYDHSQIDDGAGCDHSQNNNGMGYDHSPDDDGPSSNCASKEMNKRRKENLSFSSDGGDMDAATASQIFKTADDMILYVRNRKLGNCLTGTPEATIRDFFQKVIQDQMEIGGKPVKSIRATLLKWEVYQNAKNSVTKVEDYHPRCDDTYEALRQQRLKMQAQFLAMEKGSGTPD